MKIARCLLWPAVSITTCLAAPTSQDCTDLNKIVSAAGVQTQATSFCNVFIPPKTITQSVVTTTTSTTANPTPTLTITLVVSITPAATTITTTWNLCTPTARKLVREPTRDDMVGRGTPSMDRSLAFPRAGSPSLDFQGRAVSSPVANLQILGTSKDKRPSVWRLFAADALIQACACLGISGTPQTVTVTSTTTAFTTAAQVITTATTTTTLSVPTVSVTGATTQFRLVTNTSDILYLEPGNSAWHFQAYTSTTDSPGFFLYTIQGSSLVSTSSDCLRVGVSWGSTFCQACSLDANLQLHCDSSFYEVSNTRVQLVFDSGGVAVQATAVPYCPAA